MLLANKRLLITGVLTQGSIAWHTARIAQEQGAEIALTGFGRGMSLTERAARRLPGECQIYELDINRSDQMDSLAAELGKKWGGIDGALHAIAFAPEDALGGNFLTAPSESAALAFTTSAFSYKTLAAGLLPLFQSTGGGALVTLDFDNSTQAWPGYDWMGVCKAALISVTRYLARDLGPHNVRVNAVSAGPLSTVAAKSIAGFSRFEEAWNERAPLRWDASDPTPVANMICVMLSDFSDKVTGEVVRVDGGFHAVAIDGGQATD